MQNYAVWASQSGGWGTSLGANPLQGPEKILMFATCHSLRPLVPQSLDASKELNRDIDEFVDELNLRDLQKAEAAESADQSKSQQKQSMEKHWNQWRLSLQKSIGI